MSYSNPYGLSPLYIFFTCVDINASTILSQISDILILYLLGLEGMYCCKCTLSFIAFYVLIYTDLSHVDIQLYASHKVN